MEILRLLCIKSYTVGFPVPVVFKLILLANCLIICVIHDKLLVDLFFFSCTYLYMCSAVWVTDLELRLSVIFVCDHLMDMCSGQISHKSFW